MSTEETDDVEAERDHWKLTAERFIAQDRRHNRLWSEAEEREDRAADSARAEVKAAVEEWFADVSLDDLYAAKGWNRSSKPLPMGSMRRGR